MRHASAAGGPEAGAASTTLVLAVPALLTLLLLVVHAGVYFHAVHLASAAAQDGARAARLLDGSAEAGERAAAGLLDELAGGVLTDVRVQASRTATTAAVEVTGYAAPVVPLIRWPVRARSEGPVEVFTAP